MLLDDAISHWASATPDAQAILSVGKGVTYKELELRSLALARVLNDFGIGRGHRVGVHLDKSISSFVAVYGVLKAGAAYVPLDPAAPTARLKTIVSDCEMSIVITDERKSAVFPNTTRKDGNRVPHIDVEGRFLTEIEEIESLVIEGPRVPSDLAYILYTSGSTGQPKGISHTHKSGMAYASMAAALCDLGPKDRVSNHTPLHFDMSIFDVFSTSSVGACSVVIPEMYAKIPASLAKLIEQEQVSVWYSVPFAITQLTERGGLDKRDFNCLRVVMYAGEKIQPWQLREFAKHSPDAIYINAYGPTETNHFVSKVMRFEDLDGETQIPIGVPADGAEILIQSVDGPAEHGELLVSSDQCMTGYWNDAARTADAFLKLKSGNGSEKRFYATGDLVRRVGNGDLELIGRKDYQVKVRGFRVELGEIETVMSGCPGVAEATAILREDSGELWGFARIYPDAIVARDALHDHCAQTLPSYAIPQHFVTSDELPRTSTGKVDRTRMLEMTHA